jgi:hypothetical protein
VISPAGLTVLTSPDEGLLVNKRQRVITGVGLAAGLVAGGGAGLILEASGSAGATAVSAVATDPSSPTTPATPTPPPNSSGSAAPSAATPSGTSAKAARDAQLKKVLQSLVDDGTLTQAQVDAVIAKLDAAGPAGRPGGGRPGFGGRRGVAAISLQTVATTLGVTVDDVRTALRNGTTIAAYAVTKGKTAQDVIDALVAAAKSALDAQVKAGTITQAQEDTRLTAATTKITDFVNNGTPQGGPKGGPGVSGGAPGARPGGRAGGHGARANGGTTPSGSAPSTTTPPTTTAPSPTPVATG